MAQAQARAEAQPFEFHVPLADEVEPESAGADAEETGSDAATDAEAQPEQAEAEHIEKEEPDPDADPSESLRKKYNAQYSRKLEADRKRIREELLAELKQRQPEQPAAQQAQPEAKAAAESDDPIDAVYKIDLDSFQPDIKYREGSDLAEYGDELREYIGQAVKQGIQHTLQGIRANDKQLRQQMTVAEKEQSAGKVISGYLEEIKDHPDFEDKWPELQKLGQLSRDLAMNDPERWIRLAERELELPRDWRGQKQAEQQQAGKQNQQLANKPRSIVQRPSRAASSSGAASDGSMSFDAALNAAFRKAGL